VCLAQSPWFCTPKAVAACERLDRGALALSACSNVESAGSANLPFLFGLAEGVGEGAGAAKSEEKPNMLPDLLAGAIKGVDLTQLAARVVKA
jgi:hypothetical protein